LKQIFSLPEILKALELSPTPIIGFNPADWGVTSDNICLSDGRNTALFERDGDAYYGHWFCKDSGKIVKSFAKECFALIFKKVNFIKGLTPVDNIPARWMAKQCGFKSYGQIKTRAGDMILFILTKKEFMNE